MGPMNCSVIGTVACDVLRVTDLPCRAVSRRTVTDCWALLRRQYPDLPVILVTMFANVATLRASLAHGARAISSPRARRPGAAVDTAP